MMGITIFLQGVKIAVILFKKFTYKAYFTLILHPALGFYSNQNFSCLNICDDYRF